MKGSRKQKKPCKQVRQPRKILRKITHDRKKDKGLRPLNEPRAIMKVFAWCIWGKNSNDQKTPCKVGQHTWKNPTAG